ncbi:MAG: GEVED domain-containing protein [Flavobacteriales bacterium]
MKTKIQSFFAALFLLLGTATAQYCTPTFSSGCSFGDQILNFSTTGGSTNITNNNSGCSPGYYAYVTGQQVTQLQGQNVTLSMQAGPTWGQGFKVWIDWNNNLSFADAGELVYTSPGSGITVNTTVVTVPFSATAGTKRMRVVCSYAGIPPTLDGCPLNQTYGECEDYDFVVVASTACSGTPVAGTAVSSASPVCPSVNYTLSLSGSTQAAGLTYQWQSAPSATGPWTNIPTGTTPSFTTSQLVDTWYKCTVTCSGQSATSSVVAVATNSFLACYCGSQATSTADEEILNVSLNTLNNTSTCTTTGGTGSIQSQYSNYTALTPTILTTGASFPLSVQIGTCGGNYNNATKVWIDYNQNGSFADPGEEVYASAAVVSGPHIETGTITIPTTAATGNTMMRVVNVETWAVTNINPCGNYTWGETEDYYVNIIAATPCTGTPSAGDAVASATTVCPSTTVNMSLANSTIASGITYQWLSASAATGPWTPISGANNSTYSTTISADTYFACILNCTNSNASDTSTAVLVLSTPFFQCYCATVNAGGAGSLMDNVAFGNGGSSFWNNNTSTTQPTASPYYSSFTTGPDVIQGMDYTMGVTIQAPLVYTGAIVSVWIDYDHSGSYDPSEWTQVGTNIAGNTTGTVNITIPMTALTGNTGMRVRSRGAGNINGAPNACTNMGSGETEDYIINILPAPDCANPTGITATTGVDSILTNWNWSQTVLPLTGFNMQLVEAGMPFSSGTSYVLNANTTDTLVNPAFIAGQSFVIYLQSVCGQDTSYFIGPVPVVLPMTNDDMCNAAAIPVDGYPYIFNNTGATVNPAEATVVPPATGAQTTTGWDNQNLNLTTWFTFVAPPSGNVRINSTALNYNGQIAVYAATDCAITGSFTLQAANDDDLDGANQAPNFTICGLNAGDTYYLLHDAFNNTAGNYAIAISPISLNAGVEGEVLNICYGDTVNLFNGIANYQTGGTWTQTIPTLGLQGSDFVTTGLATVMFEFTYTMEDGCAIDQSNAYVDVFPASSAGTNGTFTVCKNEPFNLLAGLSGTVDFGGYWLDPSNNPLAGNIDTASNIPGNFNYDYIVSNGVCPADTSTVLVVVDGSCDFTAGIETLAGSFNVYPNPTSSTLFVDNSMGLTIDKIELIDMSGRIVMSVVKGSFNNELAELNVSNLTTGVYTVKMTAGQTSVNQRLIKQ